MTSVDERMSSADSGAELPRDMLSAGASVLALRIPRRLAVKHDTIQHHSAASPFTYTPFEGRGDTRSSPCGGIVMMLLSGRSGWTRYLTAGRGRR